MELICCATARPASINYVVAEDGTVSDVVASPDTADVRTGDRKIDVRFSNDERVRIRVRSDDGHIKISVDERIRCRDAEDPTFNGSTCRPRSTTTTTTRRRQRRSQRRAAR